LRAAAASLAFLLFVAAGACTDSSVPAPAGSVVVCGAINSSAAVPVVIDATSTASGLRLSILSVANGYPALAFFATLPGEALLAITYDATNGAAASTTVVESPTGGTTWRQVSAQGASVGTFSLMLLDAGEAVAIDGGTEWPAPEGTLTGTLVPLGTLVDAGVGIGVSFGVAAACDAGL
jgi:hypothetical protein